MIDISVIQRDNVTVQQRVVLNDRLQVFFLLWTHHLTLLARTVLNLCQKINAIDTNSYAIAQVDEAQTCLSVNGLTAKSLSENQSWKGLLSAGLKRWNSRMEMPEERETCT
jgi:hypothetical protein